MSQETKTQLTSVEADCYVPSYYPPHHASRAIPQLFCFHRVSRQNDAGVTCYQWMKAADIVRHHWNQLPPPAQQHFQHCYKACWALSTEPPRVPRTNSLLPTPIVTPCEIELLT